jgi:predicted DCC family thiol-disulfide oxidoreductase YuxK
MNDNTSLPANTDLPSLTDYPEADIVIYDGKCVFCTGQVRNLKWLDGKNRLAFASLHDPIIGEMFPDLSHEQMMEQLYLIPGINSGKHHLRLGGAEAIRYLSRRLPKLWLAAPLLHLPFSLPIWQWGYQQVAKRRYRIANKNGEACSDDGTCDLHFKK